MDTLNFTKTTIATLPYTDTGRKKYKDVEIDNLFLVVGKTTKTYYLMRKFRGKVRRIKIGDATMVVPNVARNKAREMLGQMSMGKDPARAKAAAKNITLRLAWAAYKARRALKPRTIKDYEDRLNREFADWLDRPIVQISGAMATERHSAIGKRDGEYANGCMRTLRAIINFSMHEYVDSSGAPIITLNPVTKLSNTKSWFPTRRRQSYLDDAKLSVWLPALYEFHNRNTRDYLLLVLLSGLRREDAAGLEWSRVNLENRSITIPEPKNSRYTGIDHVFPISSQLLSILKDRYDSRDPDNQWVFPGKPGEPGEPSKPWNGYWKHIYQLHKMVGFEFTIHDLRRTFATVAESLDMSQYALKRLLNHKMKGDVTAGYIGHSIDRLRAPAQMIADKILGERPDSNKAAKSTPAMQAA